MSAFGRIARSVLRRVRSAARRIPSPGSGDGVLTALAAEYLANERALGALLARDGRDADDIPGFTSLADRQAELAALIASTPARGFAGLVAKARAVRLRPLQVGYDAAAALGWSLAGDVLRLFGDGRRIRQG